VEPQWRAVRCDLGENPYPRLKLHWLVMLQWLAAPRDRLRVAERAALPTRVPGAPGST